MSYKNLSTCFDKVMGSVKNESVPRNESIFGQIIINERMKTKMSNSLDSLEPLRIENVGNAAFFTTRLSDKKVRNLTSNWRVIFSTIAS